MSQKSLKNVGNECINYHLSRCKWIILKRFVAK
uniref:Uncharacterized protein n=1 Tax=Wuchereria bancrofti TaxID=6293 RepID=A0AAF5PYR7_WUCBA